MALRRFRAIPATEQRYGLAEGPFWDGDRNRVLWVDINAGAVHAGAVCGRRVREESVLHVPGTASAVVTSADGGLLVAGARRLHTVSRDGDTSDWAEIIPETTASRLNDGGCDPAGRFLVGSLALDTRIGEEVLVSVDTDGRVTVIDDDLGLSNGLAFTPDGTRLYSTDTRAGIIWVRDYDVSTGATGRRDELLRIEDGKPDGLCLDRAGNLWIAVWGAGQVRCHSPAGDLLAVVDVAAPNTSSLAFVSADLNLLVITTASEQLTDEQLEAHPDSGRLFIAEVDVRGLPVPGWAGRA